MVTGWKEEIGKMNRKRKERKARFHNGADYAVVMLGDETTENASIYLYGSSEEVIYYGHLIECAINDPANR